MKFFTQPLTVFKRISLFLIFLYCFNQSSQSQVRMRANLMIVDNTGATLMDGNMTNYDNLYSNAVDGYDIWKMTNFGENFGILRSAANLIAERRSLIVNRDTTYFRMWNMQIRNYRIQVITENLNQFNLVGYVHDNYLNHDTPIDLNDTTNVDFTVNNIPGSYASDRFKLMYADVTSGPLPVTFTGIQAQRKNNDIWITWNVENEFLMEKYIVEVAADAVNFKELKQVISTNSSAEKSYDALDVHPGAGNHFYRIKAISLGAKVQYSTIVKVGDVKNAPIIHIYPNPVVGNKVQLQLNNFKTGFFQLKITDVFGKIVYSEKLLCNTTQINKTILLNQPVAKGIYQLIIIGEDGTRTSQQLLIQ